MAHHIDVGGGAPGLNMAARELLQEGLVIPPSRWNAGDWNGGRLQRLIEGNIRVPEQSIGDLNAQFAGNAIGAKRVQALAQKFGPDTVAEAMDELIRYGERRMRAAIRGVPDGVYRGEDRIDDDGAGGGPVAIRCAMTVVGEEIAIDFVGTDPQVATNMNCPYASTLAASYSCVKGVLTDPETPFNAGSLAPITIDAPLGTISTRAAQRRCAHVTAVNRVFDAVMKAFAAAVPGRAIATGFDTTTGPYLSRRSDRRYQVYHRDHRRRMGDIAGADGSPGWTAPAATARTLRSRRSISSRLFRVLESCPHPLFRRGGASARRARHPPALSYP